MASPIGGIDPEYLKALQALAAQMGPSDADKKQALNMGLLQAGLGLMSSNKPTGMAIGDAGQKGLTGYQTQLQQLSAQRAQNIAQAGGVYKLGKDAQMTQLGMDAYNKYIQGQGGGPGVGGGGGSAPNNFGSMGDVLSAVGGPAGDIYRTAGAVPPSAPPTSGASDRQMLGGVGLAQGFAKGDVVPALNFLFKDPVSMRKDAGYMDPTTGVFHPGMTAPPGYTFNPQTQQMQKVEGGPEAFASNAGAVTGAQEQAKAGLDLIPVPIGDGTTQMMTRADAAAFLRSKQPATQPSAAGGINVNLKNATPADIAAMQNDIAKTSALGRTADPVQLAGKEAYAKQGAEALVGREKEINEAGRNGAFASARWSEMQKLGTTFDSGALTPMRSHIAGYFNALGANPETVKAVAGGSLPAMEGFGKLSFESALSQIKAFSTRPAAQEVVLALQNNPNISMTVPGRNLLMATNKALADYNVQMMKDMSTYKREKGTTEGFEAMYYDSHPPEAVLPSLAEIEKAVNGPTINSGKAAAPASGWAIKKL